MSIVPLNNQSGETLKRSHWPSDLEWPIEPQEDDCHKRHDFDRASQSGLHGAAPQSMSSILNNALELTPFQKLFYNEWLLNPTSTAYNMVLDQILCGPIDVAKLNQSVIRFVNAQLLLNSSVRNLDDKVCWVEKEPIPSTAQFLSYFSKGYREQDLYEAVLRPFDLHNDRLGRFCAFQLDDNRIRIIFILQHIVIDGSSCRSVFEECSKYYNDENYINPISLSEQRRLHEGLCNSLKKIISENQTQMSEFWKRHLEGVSGDTLDFLKPATFIGQGNASPEKQSRVSEFRFYFNAETLSKAKQLKRKYRLTPYLFGQLVFGILLHKLGGQKHLGISFPVAIPEGKELIYGAHINNLIVPFRFSEETTVSDLAASVLAYFTELKATKSKYLPTFEIVQHIEDNRWQDCGFIQTDLKDIPMIYQGVESVEVMNDWNIDLPGKLLFEQELLDSRINYRVRYDHEALDGKLVRGFVRLYREFFGRVLEDLLAGHADKKVRDYGVLNVTAHHKLVHSWNETERPYPSGKTVHRLFEEQVDRTPEQVAVVYEGRSLTFRELNERSNQLAACLRSIHRIQPDDFVALCIGRSESMLVAILAVLKAGGAYVPLDTAYPEERLRFILQDTQTRVALTDEPRRDLMERLRSGLSLSVESIDCPEFGARLTQFPKTNLIDAVVRPENLFYVVYTSGTTGNPKGVMIEHQQIVPVIEGIRDAYDFEKRSKISAFTSFGFDVSSSEFFISLLYGNELHVLSERLRTDVDALSAYLEENEIEYVYLPPAVLAALPKRLFQHLRTIIYAGEPCDRAAGEYWSATKRLFNYYGPTETNIATGKLIQEGDVHLIGKPIANATVYVLDQHLNPLPIGAIGELYIGGAGVARGYLNQPELTRERFLANPFQTAEQKQADRNSRLYKTGDLVRYLSSGDLEFIGRNDQQVKIRGYRIELGEIESRMCQFPGVSQAVALAWEEGAAKYLAGYYVAEGAVDQEALLASLEKHLPEYMVPSALVELEKLPLTINGKVDRKRLPEPERSRSRVYRGPENRIQEQLCQVYGEVLGMEREQVGIDDDFFRLGGNSILAIQLMSRINKTLSSSISVAQIFTSKTIRNLSNQIEQRSAIVRLNSAAKKENMFMIHPGFAGCEVYAPIAQALCDDFCCLGVDSYNLYHKEVINDLSHLADRYLSSIERIGSKTLQERYVFFGWSLGGHIALEMAAQLEAKGVEHITIYLLDTILNDETLHLNSSLTKQEVQQLKSIMGSAGVHGEDHEAYVAAERDLSAQPVSGTLRHTQVILFKAMQQDQKIKGATSDQLIEHVRQLECNNVDKILASKDQINVIKLNSASHWTILNHRDAILAEIKCRHNETANSQRKGLQPTANRQNLDFISGRVLHRAALESAGAATAS